MSGSGGIPCGVAVIAAILVISRQSARRCHERQGSPRCLFLIGFWEKDAGCMLRGHA